MNFFEDKEYLEWKKKHIMYDGIKMKVFKISDKNKDWAMIEKILSNGYWLVSSHYNANSIFNATTLILKRIDNHES